MNKFNNQLFYLISYVVKKYDGKWWHLYENYYITGGMFIGMMIAIEICTIVNFICLFVYPSVLRVIYGGKILGFFFLAIAMLTTSYIKHDRRCDVIYEKISGYNKGKKMRILFIQIFRIIILLSVNFLSLDMIRETMHSAGTDLSKRLIEYFFT